MSQHVRLRAGSALLGAVALGASLLGPIGAAQAVPAYDINGTVHLPTGMTVDDAYAVAYTLDPEAGWAFAGDTPVVGNSDGVSGAFVLADMAPDTYRVCVYDDVAPGPALLGCYAQDGGTADVVDASDIVVRDASVQTSLTLAPPRTISGTIRSANGSLPTDAQVHLYRLGKDHTYHFYEKNYDFTYVDDHGTFAQTVLPGTYKLYADTWDPDLIGEYLGGSLNEQDGEAVDVSAGSRDDADMTFRYYVDEPTTRSTLTGAPVEGQTLAVHPGAWSADKCGPASGLSYDYSWFSRDSLEQENSGEDVGAGPTYPVGARDIGKYLSVGITATSPTCVGNDFAQMSSKVVAAPKPAPKPAAPTAPTQMSFNGATVAAATGKPTVGGTLSAPTLSLPPNATVAFQWYRVVNVSGGHRVKTIAIGGARGSKYKLKKKDKGTKVFVVETVSAPGYATAKASSKKVRVR